jgi:hypothetical protein
MVCLEGWVDLDKVEDNGCECKYLSADDPPDGVDQNCDGIDGDPANAIFVAETGNDLNPGTPDQPVQTVHKGIERALEKGKKHVYVAQGDYPEAVALAEGVRVFGGFQPGFAVRDFKTYVSVIVGTPLALPGTVQAAVSAVGIGKGAAPSSFEGFTVLGPDVYEPGRATYGIYLFDCQAGLTIKDNLVVGGTAGPGEDGLDGLNGEDGTPGGNGNKAFDLPTESCFGQTPAPQAGPRPAAGPT